MTLEQARGLIRRGERQFNVGNYEPALRLYLQAEEVAQAAIGPDVEEVAFWALGNALRCFERSITQSSEPGTEYETHALRFLRTYESFEPSRRRAATGVRNFYSARRHFHTFRAWESRYYSALEVGNFEDARKSLKTLVENASLIEAPDLQLKVASIHWRSQLECLKAMEELARPPSERDMEVIARAFEAAALWSVPPTGPPLPSMWTDRILFYQHMHASNAARWRANSLLNDAGSRPAVSLRAALAYLEEALRQALAAERLGWPEADAHPQVEYVSFWRSATAYRLAVLQYVRSSTPENLRLARIACGVLITDAKSICEVAGEHRIFPNRFYSLAHVELEPLWLDAIERLAASEFERSRESLERYCDEFPEDFRDSWWHLNARVRLCITRALQALSETDRATAATHLRDLSLQLIDQPCGRHAVELMRELESVCRGRSSLRESLPVLLELWPIDAYPAEFLAPADPDPMRRPLSSLPAEAAEALANPGYPGDQKFNRSWNQLMAMFIDYYGDAAETRSSPKPVVAVNRVDLTRQVFALPAMADISHQVVEWVEKFAEDPKNFWADRARLTPILGRAPLVVQIDPDQARRGQVWFARPRWARPNSAFKIAIRADSNSASDFHESRWWYLPAQYRKGNRPSLPMRDLYLIKPAAAMDSIPVLRAELDARKDTASRAFERLVRRYVQVLVRHPYIVQSRAHPETDLYLETNTDVLLGEIKFTSKAHVDDDEVRKAIDQLEYRRLNFDPEGRNAREVMIINGEVREPVLAWVGQKRSRAVWVVILNDTASRFVERLDAEINAIMNVSPVDGTMSKLRTEDLG